MKNHYNKKKEKSMSFGLNGLLFNALQEANISKLNTLLEQGYSLLQDPSVVTQQLSKTNSLDLIRTVKETNFPLDFDSNRILKGQIKKGNVEIIKFVLEHVQINEYERSQYLESSLYKNNKEIIQLFQDGILTERALNDIWNRSIKVGYFDSVQFLITKEYIDENWIKLNTIEKQQSDKNIQDWINRYFQSKNLSDNLNKRLDTKEATSKKTKI